MLIIEPKYFKYSNPEKVISAPVGSIFARVGDQFHLVDGITKVGTRLEVNKRIFLMEYRTADWFQVIQENQILFEQPHEMWKKVSGGDGATGWKFTGYLNLFYNRLPDYTQTATPTPTPTPIPNEGVDSFDAYSTGPISSLTDISSWWFTGSLGYMSLNDYSVGRLDDIESYSLGSINSLSYTGSWPYTGSLNNWAPTWSFNAVDDMETYPLGAISSLTETGSWTYTGSLANW